MKVGFIGAGNMAQAIFRRWIEQGKIAPASLYISELDAARRRSLQEQYGLQVAQSNADLVQSVDVAILAIKPNQSGPALDEIGRFAQGKSVLSIVTGLTTQKLCEKLPGASVARIMPNTPAMVGEGVFAVSLEHTLSEDRTEWMRTMFETLGRVFFVAEKDMDAVVGISGSGPAYAFVMIEAMADAGVLQGLSRDLAYKLAAQTLIGAGRMVLEGGHPAALKDAVSSPAGTTIEAIYSLEKNGFRYAVMDAVSVCTDKARSLRKAQESSK